MARIRTVKPEFYVSESLAEVSLTAERTFGGLITQADDEGRYKDNAAILHGAVWALRPSHTAAGVESDLAELAQEGLIHRYTVNGRRFLHLVTFNIHQKVSHPTPSKLPECPQCNGPAGQSVEVLPDPSTANGPPGASPEASGFSPESSGGSPIGSGLGSGSGMEVEGETKPPTAPPSSAGKPRTHTTGVPDHFEITENLSAWAAEKSLTPDVLAVQTERFLDHHRAKGNTFKDWNAAWRKWMSNAAEWAQPKAGNSLPPQRSPTSHQTYRDADASTFRPPK